MEGIRRNGLRVCGRKSKVCCEGEEGQSFVQLSDERRKGGGMRKANAGREGEKENVLEEIINVHFRRSRLGVATLLEDLSDENSHVESILNHLQIRWPVISLETLQTKKSNEE